MDNHKKPR